MEYRSRHIESKIKSLFNSFPALTLTGARQVGKTTLIEHLFSGQLKTITFDPIIDVGEARRDPEFFLQNNPPPVFLDEIQYAPEVLGPIKRIIDKNNRNGLYLLSGSQNLSMLKNVSESLAGRTAIVPLYAFSHAESLGQALRASFLEEWVLNGKTPGPAGPDNGSPIPVYPSIFTGGYPKTIQLNPEHLPVFWESYMQTYIERDIRRVSNIGSIQTFGKFISLLAALTAQEINFNELGRELNIDRRTAQSWTEIARATYQWFTLPAFSGNAVKRVSGKEKGYFTDTGFACSLMRISGPDAIPTHPMAGSLFETYVVLEVLKRIQAWPVKPAMYHYRSAGGGEVDCVLELDNKLWLLEIKATARPTAYDARGFASFRRNFPSRQIAGACVICAVEEMTPLADGAFAMPWWRL